MNYLPNDRNLVRDAALSATNIAPSRVYYRTDETEKAGGGTVSLAGDYIGDTSITVDVEVLDEGGSDRAVSTPTFAGTGSGTMTAITADATVDAQEFVVTLKDLGTLTRAARTPFQGSAVVARLPGADGNDIRITVDQSGIVAVLSPDFRYSLQADVQAGVNEYTGAHLWNFRTPYLNADGTVPDESPRIRFGDDPQVYRPYKRRVGQQDVFSFSPAPVRNAEAGTPLKLVTGAYSITVTDGDTPQVLGGIVTVYDALVALQNATLVTVEGVGPIHDRAPGGQAAVDLSLWTRPYVASIDRDGSTYVKEAALPISVGADVPAETLSIECVDVSVAGGEMWRVRGDVSGTLAQAITDVLYSAGGYTFTIPRPSVVDEGVVGEIRVRFNRPGVDEANSTVVLPNFKAIKKRLGIGAKNGTWTYRYLPRPQFCNEEGEVTGGPSIACLGMNPPPEEGEIAMDDARLRRRLERVHSFLHEFIRTQTRVPPLGGKRESIYNQLGLESDAGTLGMKLATETIDSPVADQDIRLVNKAGNVIAQVLRDLAKVPDKLSNPRWQADQAYALDSIIDEFPAADPVPPGDYARLRRYAANFQGSSGSTAPAFPEALGEKVLDNTSIQWENVGRTPLGMVDELFELLRSDVELLKGRPLFANPPFPQRLNDSSYDLGAIVVATSVEVVSTQLVLRCTVGGTSANGQPEFAGAKMKDALVDGGVTWEVVGMTLVGADAPRPEGESVSVPPAPPLTHGYAKTTATFEIPDDYLQRWISGANAIRAAVGIDPTFEESSSLSGDGCWTDFPEVDMAFRCVTPDADYAPIFPNVYYHSVMRQEREDGSEFYATTQEFGFGPQFGCADLIAPGDELIVEVRNINGISTYQQGDRFDAQIVRAEPLGLAGGQTGNDTLLWSVIGGVAGALPDYALALTSPAPYSAGGIGFAIVPGPVPFELGAQFRFSVQAARGQWRVDGGGWSTPFAIGPAGATLVDGLSVLFSDGVAPSWVPGDRWTFAVEATNGVDQIRAPTDARAAWTGSTVIEIAGGPIEGVMLGDHTIPSDATVTLTGSDDGFATTSLSVVLPWHRGSMWRAVIANHGAYRLSINRGGSLNWLWMGDPLQLEMSNGLVEWGALTMRYRLPGATRRAGFGLTAAHEGVAQSSFDAWLESIMAACRDDDRRIGVVPLDTRPEAGIVTVDADSVDVTEVQQFQPADASLRLLAFNVDLAPIA